MAHTTENSTGFITLPATAVALGLGVRVKLDSSGNVSAAGATDPWIGTTVSAVAASGNATIRLRNSSGTHMFVSAGAITRGNRLYAAASGQVDDAQTAGDPTGFVALVAAGGSGEIIPGAPQTIAPATGTITVPITLSSMTGSADVLSNYPLTFNGTIVAIDYFQGVPVTTGSKLATLNLEIDTTDLTGGTVALTSATCTPLGKTIPSAAITAGNTFTAGQTLSVESSGVTAFVEGTGYLVITYVTN